MTYGTTEVTVGVTTEVTGGVTTEVTGGVTEVSRGTTEVTVGVMTEVTGGITALLLMIFSTSTVLQPGKSYHAPAAHKQPQMLPVWLSVIPGCSEHT